MELLNNFFFRKFQVEVFIKSFPNAVKPDVLFKSLEMPSLINRHNQSKTYY